jgi:hypothetical protein
MFDCLFFIIFKTVAGSLSVNHSGTISFESQEGRGAKFTNQLSPD